MIPHSNKLPEGEVAAAVIGFLALFALFGFALFVLIKPPQVLQQYIMPSDETPSVVNTSTVGEDSGVDNPVYSGMIH